MCVSSSFKYQTFIVSCFWVYFHSSVSQASISFSLCVYFHHLFLFILVFFFLISVLVFMLLFLYSSFVSYIFCPFFSLRFPKFFIIFCFPSHSLVLHFFPQFIFVHLLFLNFLRFSLPPAPRHVPICLQSGVSPQFIKQMTVSHVQLTH